MKLYELIRTLKFETTTKIYIYDLDENGRNIYFNVFENAREFSKRVDVNINYKYLDKEVAPNGLRLIEDWYKGCENDKEIEIYIIENPEKLVTVEERLQDVLDENNYTIKNIIINIYERDDEPSDQILLERGFYNHLNKELLSHYIFPNDLLFVEENDNEMIWDLHLHV